MADREYSGYAIAGFILSFFSILAILGIIFSIVGISHTKYGRKKGRGLAIAGLIIGIIVFLSSIFAIGAWWPEVLNWSR